MKLDRDIFGERNQIINSSALPFINNPLTSYDITVHKWEIEKVYKGMLHEACVIDDCCRRFKRTFEEPRFMII